MSNYDTETKKLISLGAGITFAFACAASVIWSHERFKRELAANDPPASIEASYENEGLDTIVQRAILERLEAFYPQPD